MMFHQSISDIYLGIQTIFWGAQLWLIWIGLKRMGQASKVREKALDEIIEQGRESRRAMNEQSKVLSEQSKVLSENSRALGVIIERTVSI